MEAVEGGVNGGRGSLPSVPAAAREELRSSSARHNDEEDAGDFGGPEDREKSDADDSDGDGDEDDKHCGHRGDDCQKDSGAVGVPVLVDLEKEVDDRNAPQASTNGDEAAVADRRVKQKTEIHVKFEKLNPRSRALLGNMIGHLRSAKSRLESEKAWKTTELNMKAQERLNEKLSITKRNLQKTALGRQRREEELRAREMDRALEEKELLHLRRRLEKHYSLMMNFIRTRAEPTIFYLPAKHTKDTEQLLEETRAAIQLKIDSLKDQLQPLPEDEGLRASAAAAALAASQEAGEEAVESATALGVVAPAAPVAAEAAATRAAEPHQDTETQREDAPCAANGTSACDTAAGTGDAVDAERQIPSGAKQETAERKEALSKPPSKLPMSGKRQKDSQHSGSTGEVRRRGGTPAKAEEPCRRGGAGSGDSGRRGGGSGTGPKEVQPQRRKRKGVSEDAKQGGTGSRANGKANSGTCSKAEVVGKQRKKGKAEQEESRSEGDQSSSSSSGSES